MAATQDELNTIRDQIGNPEDQKRFDALSPQEKDRYVEEVRKSLAEKMDATPQKQSSGISLPAVIGAGYGAKGLYDKTMGLGGSEVATSGLPPGVTQVLDPKDLAGYEPASAAAPGSGIGMNLPTAASVAAALHGGYGVKKSYDVGNRTKGAMSGAEAGAGVGWLVGGPVGVGVGAGVGAISGALVSGFKTGKDMDQQSRDKVRKDLKASGFVDDSYNVSLADGAKFDIGKDGHAMLANEGGGERHYYDADLGAAGVGDKIGAVNPLAAILTGGDEKLKTDYAGYFTNAITSSGDANANAKSLYEKAGLDRDKAFSAINQLEADKRISTDDANAYRNGVNTVFGQEAPAASTSTPKKTSSKPSVDEVLNKTKKRESVAPIGPNPYSTAPNYSPYSAILNGRNAFLAQPGVNQSYTSRR